MKIELIDYTKEGINKIARLTRATRKNKLDDKSKLNNKDEKFVKGLIKVKHYGTLEHINFTFHISDVSRVLTHQLVRHRLASYLQMSNRHAKPNGYFLPKSIPEIEYENYSEHMKNSYELYENLIKRGVSIEDARYVLPPAFFTHITITMNSRTLRHFLELRMNKAAQLEIRELACKLFDIVYDIYPILFEDLKSLRDSNEE